MNDLFKDILLTLLTIGSIVLIGTYIAENKKDFELRAWTICIETIKDVEKCSSLLPKDKE